MTRHLSQKKQHLNYREDDAASTVLVCVGDIIPKQNKHTCLLICSRVGRASPILIHWYVCSTLMCTVQYSAGGTLHPDPEPSGSTVSMKRLYSIWNHVWVVLWVGDGSHEQQDHCMVTTHVTDGLWQLPHILWHTYTCLFTMLLQRKQTQKKTTLHRRSSLQCLMSGGFSCWLWSINTVHILCRGCTAE